MKHSTWAVLVLTTLIPRICFASSSPDTEPRLLHEPDSSYTDSCPEHEDFLEEYTDFNVCRYLGMTSTCAFVAAGWNQAIKAFALTSQNNESNIISGTASDGTVKYRYHTIGRHRDTTTEVKFIVGAIEHHLKKKEDGKLCRTECIDLTQSNVWNGYLLVGPADHFEGDMYCGPELGIRICFRSNIKGGLS